MTVVIYDVDTTKRDYLVSTPDIEAKMLSLKDYTEIARRCIGAFACGPVAVRMIRDDDAVSFVAEHLMYGTINWKPDGGRTLRSYLNYCAICAIKRWMVKSRQANSRAMVSLNANTMDDSRMQTYEIVADGKSIDPLDTLCKAEDMDVQSMIDAANLNKKQRHCMECVYVQNMTASEVARQLGISREAVRQHLTRGRAKIKAILNDKIS